MRRCLLTGFLESTRSRVFKIFTGKVFNYIAKMKLTKKSLKEISSHSESCYPEECCGVITLDGRAQKVLRAENEHPDDRTKYFKIPAPFYVKCRNEADSIIAIYHSHPNGPRNFSIDDIAISEVLETPIVMMEWPKGDYIYYEPKHKGKMSYLARPFVLGILDCYTLIRDYYLRELDIHLPRDSKSYPWWEKGESLYLDNVVKYFNEVDGLENIQVHDCVLMHMVSKVPEHGAIYVGDSKILHHPIGNLSRHSVFSRFYQEKVHSVWRHKSMWEDKSE